MSNTNRVYDKTIRKLERNLLTETSDGLMKFTFPLSVSVQIFSTVECKEYAIGSDIYSFGTYNSTKISDNIPMSAQFDGFLK